MITALKINHFWAICIQKLNFFNRHHVENRPGEAAAVICVSFVFYLGQFEPSRWSRAPATSMSVLVSPGIQMRMRLVREELCDFHLMRLKISSVRAGKAGARWPLHSITISHKSLKDWKQQTEATGRSCISLTVKTQSAGREDVRVKPNPS